MVRKYALIFETEHNLFQEASIFLKVKLNFFTSKTKCGSNELVDHKESIVKDKLKIVEIEEDCDKRQTANLTCTVCEETY